MWSVPLERSNVMILASQYPAPCKKHDRDKKEQSFSVLLQNKMARYKGQKTLHELIVKIKMKA
jgi:hypothetical protein